MRNMRKWDADCQKMRLSCRKWGRKTSFSYLFFQKSFIWGKSKCSAAQFRYLLIALTLHTTKTNRIRHQIIDPEIFNFDFLENGLGIVSPPNFVYDFSRKMFLMLWYINWPRFIVWLLLLIEILFNMCIAIVCFPGCDITDFEIDLIILIKPFFYLAKSSRESFKHLENKKSF